LVVEGVGVATIGESPAGVARAEDLAGAKELEANNLPASLAFRARVASCIVLNLSWLLIISAKQERNNLVKSL
jgi:hypothetical protein